MQAKDTRDLFAHLTRRKESEWGRSPIPWTSLGTPLQARLLELERVFPHTTTPCADYRVAEGEELPLEHLVIRKGVAHYVNTEGANYARYMFPISGFPEV